MKIILFLAACLALPLANASPFGKLEFDEKICGALIYTQGSYVLEADHGDNYTVRQSKFDREDLPLTGLMKSIVTNHDYTESKAPQVCFLGMGSERVSENELDVLSLEDVISRDSIN
jgi:hypothetical protein